MKNLRDENEQTQTTISVTWYDVERFVEWLAEKTNNFKDFNGVYGPARGGLIYAVMISERYNLPFLAAPQKGCICVDDIVDSGVTALAWKDKGYTIASHYYKINDKVEPDYWMDNKLDNWIIFPWEQDNKEALIYQIQNSTF